MKKEEQEEKNPEIVITSKDIENLRGKLRDFPQKTINGRITSSFEQYMHSVGCITFKEDGTLVVNAPAGYTRMSLINTKLELRQYYEDQEFFAQNPEAKEAQLEKIQKLREGLASKLSS